MAKDVKCSIKLAGIVSTRFVPQVFIEEGDNGESFILNYKFMPILKSSMTTSNTSSTIVISTEEYPAEKEILRPGSEVSSRETSYNREYVHI